MLAILAALFAATSAILLHVAHPKPPPQLAPSLTRALLDGTVPKGATAAACHASATGQSVFGAFRTRLDGKVVLVTGGYSGIGLAIAQAAAERGAAVVIAGHNEEHAIATASTLRQLTRNDNVRGMLLDLASFASVRAFAVRFQREYRSLDHLVLNAGTASSTGRLTADGFDELFQIDFLGHALLTELLIDMLRLSHGVVISTASGVSENACEALGACHTRMCDCMATLDWLPPPAVDPESPVVVHFAGGPVAGHASTYGISKWAQIYWSKALAARERAAGSAVRAFSWTPSLVVTPMVSGLSASTAKLMASHAWYPNEAAAVAALLMAAPHAFDNGGYFSRDVVCEDRVPVAHGFTEEMQPALLAHVAELVGL